MNNFAVAKVCRNCNCYLKRAVSKERLEIESNPTAFLSFTKIAAAGIICLILIGFIYNYASNIYAKNRQSDLDVKVGTEIELPREGWYKTDFWKYYRKYPTVTEIIEKNNSVTSKTVKPADINSISMKGTLSFADLGCLTNECYQKEREAEEERKRNEDTRIHYYYGWRFYNPYSQTNFKTLEQTQKELELKTIKDDFNRFDYKEIGRCEFYQKKPDKSLQRFFVDDSKDIKKFELSNGFNGFNGWEKKVTYDLDKISDSSVEEIPDEDLKEMKESAKAFFRMSYDVSKMKVVGLAKLNEKVNFLVERQTDEGLETMYFDAVTGFLTKIESGKIIVHFFPYENFSGIYFPSAIFSRAITKEGRLVWMRIEKISWGFNETMDDSIFEKPTK